MKSMLMTIGSAALLLASVQAVPTTNLPQQAGNCFIRMKNGDGDASVSVSILANKLFSTVNALQAQAGVNAEAVTPGCVCQAFSDNAGTKKLGGIFTDSTLASFSDTSSGDVSSTADQAVPVGSFCCVTAPNTVPNCSNNNTPPPPPANQKKNVRIQIGASNNASVQFEIPADGSAFAFSFNTVNNVKIVNLEGAKQATCQVFSDKNGTKAVGCPFGTHVVFLNRGRDTKVLSVRCKAA